jgi:hypothetical protein
VADTRPEGAALVVRAGQKGALAAEFERQGLAAVGWPKLEDLGGLRDRIELRQLLESTHAANEVNQSVLELGDFLFALKPGSRVVTYNPLERYYLVGEVVGGYEYRPELGLRTKEEPFKHIRRVEWRRGAARGDLSEATKNEFPPYKTTFWIDGDALAEIEGGPGDASPKYWWVNQGTNYKMEKAGAYLWAPQKNKQGSPLRHWTDLQKAAPGDLVFNYANGAIRAVSRVLEPASIGRRPDGLEESGWERDGFQLLIEYSELAKPLELEAIPAALRAGGPGPFTVDGSVKQGYFFPVDHDTGAAIERLAREVGVIAPQSQNHWAFLANPQYWDLAEAVRTKHPGDPEDWTASRPKIRDEASPGDPVILYQCGEAAGIYALANVAGPPLRRLKVINGKTGDQEEWALPLEYTQVLSTPVSKERLLAHPVLKGLTVIAGQGANFRVTPEQWAALQELIGDEAQNPWDEYVYWAGRFIEHPDFDSWERDYKFAIKDGLVTAKDALLTGNPEWPRLLKKAFADPPNNITSWQVHSKLLDWAASDTEAAGRALSALWQAPRPLPDGVAEYRRLIPDSLKPIRRAVIFAFLLMALDPTVFVPYRANAFSENYRLVDYPPGPGSDDPVGQYEYALGFADRLMAECAGRGMVLRDRLDAQSIIWTMAKSGPLDQWDDDSKARFLAYKGEVREPAEDAVSDAESIYEALCSDSVQIRFPEWVVTDYLLALAAKPFVLLSGISGTGKTQIAQIVAELLAGDEEILEAQPVKRDDPGSAFHTVGKSTLAQGLVIPRNAEHLFPDAEPGRWRVVTIRSHGGEYPANVEQVVFTDPRRAPIMRLMWKKEAKKWIRGVAEFDDVLKITPDPGNEAVFDVEVIKPQRIVRRSDARRVALVPVRADWTDNRDLLGFYNVLTERYEPTDLLRVLLRAVERPDRLHFVILDEMNLAKVEYYFADFLSAMETTERGQGIPLHDQDEDVVIELDGEDALVPRRLPIPANVFFTGTVNIDETTHMFSRKVLDRANVIEFHDADIRRHLGLPGAEANGPKVRLYGDTSVPKMLVHERNRKAERAILAGEHGIRLAAVHDILKEYNLHFGYRVADECARYLWLARAHAGQSFLDEALDLQILQKVLPKLAGNRSELQEPLERLLSFFATGVDAKLNLGDMDSVHAYDVSAARMPMSAAKVRRMLERLTAVGFTSFVE